MARELSSLSDSELGLVNDYVEAGVCETHEQALEMLILNGFIQESLGSSRAYEVEGLLKLEFHSKQPNALYSQVNDALEEQELPIKFKARKWFYGSVFPRDKETKKIILDQVEIGHEFDGNPEVIVTHIYYKGRRFNPDKKDEAIETTLGLNMFPDTTKTMIDFKSGKSMYDLRQEQLKEFKVDTYDKVPLTEKIKFEAQVYGLVKVKKEWKPFVYRCNIGKLEFNSVAKLIEQCKKEDKKCYEYVCEIITTKEEGKNNFMKIITPKELVSDKLKEEIKPLFFQNVKNVTKFVNEQRDGVKSGKLSQTASTSNPTLDPEEDDLDESIFE